MNKIKKRRPWNSVSEQVYSISSKNSEGIINMNIATYITPITMDPKRYLVAVYRNTQTHKNIFNTHEPFLLQALDYSQAYLVKTFGKKSGLKINKESYLKKKNILCQYYNSLMYLTESYFVLSLLPETYINLGDHDLIVARVEKIVIKNDVSGLTTHDLQKLGIIG